MQLETSCFGIQWPLNSLSHFSVLCNSLPLYPEDTLWVTLDEVRLLEKLELSWLSHKIFSLGSFFVECKQTCKQRLTSFTALSLAYLEWKILSSEVNATKHEKKKTDLLMSPEGNVKCVFLTGLGQMYQISKFLMKDSLKHCLHRENCLTCFFSSICQKL